MLQAMAASHQAPVSEMIEYFAQKFGQMLRPGLLLSASEATGGIQPASDALAALVELLHGASLLHDDVIDRADERRGRATVHRLWGSRQAVLLGDLLLAHALEFLAPHARSKVLGLVAQITEDLAQGQLLELKAEGKSKLSIAEYDQIIEKKTATFFALAARLGATVAGASLPQEEALFRYGLELGFAYQVLDDLLDVASTSEDLGKTAGADFLNGRPTLPVLNLFEREGYGGPSHAAFLARDAEFAAHEYRVRLHQSGAFEATRERAVQHCHAAEASLAEVPDGIAKRELLGLIRYLFERLSRLSIPVSQAVRSETRLQAPRMP